MEQPTYEELLAALALEIIAADAYRERLGLPSGDGRRTYSPRELLCGRSAGPRVEKTEGTLKVILES